MGRSPCRIDAGGLKRGPWTPEEDQKLMAYIQKHGHGSWRSLPEKAGLERCGKSCRLRWINYLRPDIKRGKFSLQEQKSIIQLHALLGNRWSAIATYLPQRTDNEIKNYWNTHIKKRLVTMGIDPLTHKPMAAPIGSANGDPKKVSNLTHKAQWESARLEAEARLVKESSKQPQNNKTAGLQWRRPTQRVDKPRCLDILKAWQRLQLEAIVINDGNGGDNGNNTVESHQPTEVDDNGGLLSKSLDIDQPWNMGTCSSVIWDDDDGNDGNNVENMNYWDDDDGNDGNNDENMNYWDDVFNLVDCEP
ncbi:hypothetical protein V6N13_099472 [Hibiscus sabdariffa]|uniref:Uncharacterized protein n=1 Tax=Hibiscus sabdariffa TaxID=183260 RepID=A0ABR2PZS4_9ROSI